MTLATETSRKIGVVMKFSHIVEIPSSQVGQSVCGFLNGYCKLPRTLMFNLVDKKQIFLQENVEWMRLKKTQLRHKIAAFFEKDNIITTSAGQLNIRAIGIKSEIQIDGLNRLSEKLKVEPDLDWIQSVLLYENTKFLAVNKPAGISMHDGEDCIASSTLHLLII